MCELVCEWLAGDGYAAVAWDEHTPPPTVAPALAVVDVYGPRRETLRLRAVQAAFPRMPVIAISARFRPGLCSAGATATELGVRQVIAKPFARGQLLAAVRELAGPAKR
jgi:DNA-binding response OmpR family regulator